MEESIGTRGFERWLHRIGFAAEWARQTVESAREFATEAAEEGPDLMDSFADLEADEGDEEDEEPEAEPNLTRLAATTAAGLLATRLLRPREVNWPRAILAGVIGTLLYDAEAMVDTRLSGRKIGTRSSLRVSFAEDPDLETVMEWGARYAAGIAMASFYARYLYGRLPGPPLAQGLAFGALESATLSFGGAMRLMDSLSPGIDLPAASRGLTRDDAAPWQNVLRHLAFGAALGLIYRVGEEGEEREGSNGLDLRNLVRSE